MIFCMLLLTFASNNDVSIFSPTPYDVAERMVELADIKSTDKVYDLGCGDSRLLIIASKLHKCKSFGFDINEKCIKISLYNVDLNNLHNLVTVERKNVLTANFKDADVVFVYLFQNLTSQLVTKFNKLKSGAKVIAHNQPIPSLEPLKTESMHSKYDNEEHFIYIWQHP